MNPAIAVLFCCMAILAQGAVIIDPTIADITFNGGLSKPFGVRKMFGAAGPFNRLEKSKCIGEDCIFDPISNCIGVECNVLVENKVREMEVQKQLQDQMVLQNAQFVEQQQLLNEQKRLQQQRILTKEAGLIKQALEQETQMDEQRAFIDVAQRLQKAQLLEQMKTTPIDIAASTGLLNAIRKTCTIEGCFFTPKSLADMMKDAQFDLGTGRGLQNTIKKTCTAEGCFFTTDPFVGLEQIRLPRLT
nr:unnamed protein product [Callosobruchus analis]